MIVEIWHTDSLTDCLFARIFKRKNLSCWVVSGSELFPRISWVFFPFWPDLLVTQQCFSSTKSCIYYPFYLRKGQLLAKEKLSWKSILYVDAKPKLMVHVETWKGRISVDIYSVFVLVTRVWVYCWIFSKQNSSVLCTHVLVASHWAVTRYMLVTKKFGIFATPFATAISQRFVWFGVSSLVGYQFCQNYSTSQHLHPDSVASLQPLSVSHHEGKFLTCFSQYFVAKWTKRAIP